MIFGKPDAPAGQPENPNIVAMRGRLLEKELPSIAKPWGLDPEVAAAAKKSGLPYSALLSGFLDQPSFKKALSKFTVSDIFNPDGTPNTGDRKKLTKELNKNDPAFALKSYDQIENTLLVLSDDTDGSKKLHQTARQALNEIQDARKIGDNAAVLTGIDKAIKNLSELKEPPISDALDTITKARADFIQEHPDIVDPKNAAPTAAAPAPATIPAPMSAGPPRPPAAGR